MTFFSKKSFWEPLARFSHFWTQAWDHFYGCGAYFISVLASNFTDLEPSLIDFHVFAIVVGCIYFGRFGPHSKSFVANGLVLSKTFPKNWGGAGGRGSALF